MNAGLRGPSTAELSTRFDEVQEWLRMWVRTPTQRWVREMVVRLTEFPTVAPDAGTAFMVENEVTYLAFLDLADAVVVFGGGFAVSSLAPLPWLHGRRIVY